MSTHSLQGLKAQIERIQNNLINADMDSALKNLFIFSELLRTHFTGQKLEDFFKHPEFESIKSNARYTGSEFGSSLFGAITEVKFQLANEMEQDAYLRKVVSNTEAAILSFYKIMGINPNEQMPKDDDVIFGQYLPRVKKYIVQECKNETQQGINTLVKKMAEIAAKCRMLQKEAEGPAAKTMLKKLADGIEKINKKQLISKKYTSLEQIKHDYSEVILNSAKNISLDKPNDMSKKDVDIMRQARKLVIKAVSFMKPTFSSVKPLGQLFCYMENRLKKEDSKADKRAAEQYEKIQTNLLETRHLVGHPG